MSVWLGSARVAAAGPVVAAAVLSAVAPQTARAEVWRINDVDHSVSIHLRQRPSNRSKILAYIPVDTGGLPGGPCRGKWCPVEYKGRKGWVFSKYLMPDEDALHAAAEKAKTAQETRDWPKTLKITAQASRTRVPIYAFPNDKLPVAGHLPEGTRSVERLSHCLRNWCYVRSGALVGWIRDTMFAKPDTPAARTAEKAEDAGESGNEPHALNKTTTTATQAASINPAVAEAVEANDRKSYALAGLGGDAFLPMRESGKEDAPVVGAIPRDAKTVEGLQNCARQWCQVRYGGTTGWVLRRHLADESLETTRSFQVAGVAMWSALDVVDYPGRDAHIVGRIPAYATGIVPIGACDKTWCHVRYLGIAGWVSGRFLAPLAH